MRQVGKLKVMTTIVQKEIARGVEIARWVVDGALQHLPNRDFEEGPKQLIHALYRHPEVIDFNNLMRYAERRIDRGTKSLETILTENIPAHGNQVLLMETAVEWTPHIQDEKYTLVCDANVYRWTTILFMGCCSRDAGTETFTNLDGVRMKLYDPGGSYIQVFIGTLTACLFYAGKIVDELVEPPQWVQEISDSIPCAKDGTNEEDRVLH